MRKRLFALFMGLALCLAGCASAVTVEGDDNGAKEEAPGSEEKGNEAGEAASEEAAGSAGQDAAANEAGNADKDRKSVV